ncbi:hypothetical protein CALCODRAFT_59409 [Calocera cornea HHB12733]|uniref:Nucleolar 27S pre-rRNA processing Urb2/Npa2 C-terminal domain-containing protein n=1 Tax=Calocera cornea HHB12733 TaxID=1353952 RepID=A0A165IWX6_9BASI|nr:hypothetical protein CALCODRAFT_59409 [Calocera cornea HHB12733]
MESSASVDFLSQTVALLINMSKDVRSLTPVSIGHMWSIVATALKPAPQHTSKPDLFFAITTLITTLVRSRRALIVNSLPLLAEAIVGLLLTLRTSRPHLGSSQSRIITSTHPSWVAVEAPLGKKHAEELARLMSVITVKTPEQGYQRTTQSKLESLAKPFSRHAPYVLQAYINMITDPFGEVASETRRSLQPGVFALCSMVGDEDRDALMASLPRSTSKALFRALWQEYDKQRYVGKG